MPVALREVAHGALFLICNECYYVNAKVLTMYESWLANGNVNAEEVSGAW